MALGSSTNNGVQMAGQMLLNLLVDNFECPTCKGSGKDPNEYDPPPPFREVCFDCGGLGTVDGIIEKWGT